MTLSNSLISGRASADESICPVRGATKGARASNASSAHLNANLQITVELVTIRATTFVTANSVDASVVPARGRVALVLVDALVVIKMLNEPFRAPATIASHKVLATVLASAVIGTLVLIDAKSSRLIELEPSGTDTPETAERIDAGARFRTGSGLVALVYVVASVSVLRVTLLAAASVASLSVDAILLAQMIPCRALVQISATDAIGVQDETGRAGTDETSFRVLTIVLARSWR